MPPSKKVPADRAAPELPRSVRLPKTGRAAADSEADEVPRSVRLSRTGRPTVALEADDDAEEAVWPPGPRRATLLKEGRVVDRLVSGVKTKAAPGSRLRKAQLAATGRVTATASVASPAQRTAPSLSPAPARARPVRKRAAAAKARSGRRRFLVPTEAGLLWGLLYDLICLPLWLINLLRGRAKPGDALRPLDRLLQFALSARMTALLITLNLLVFVFELYTRHAGWSRAAFVAHFTLSTDGLGRGEQLPLITHFFSHASAMHLGGNMLALFVFGRVVERNLGPWRLLGCYLLAAVCSTALSLLAQGLSGRSVPTLGASGAVAGLLALGILLEPLTITFEALVPMPLFLVGWLAIAADFAALLGSGAAPDAVDHPAHLGGYLSVLFGYYALKRQHQEQARLGLFVNLATLLLMAGLWFFWGSRGG